MAMKILLTGATGQLGSALAQRLQVLGEVRACTRAQLDLSAPETLAQQLQQMVQTWKPDGVINAAAYTAVDRAQTESNVAQAVNADSVGVLAQFAAQQGAWMLHYATDYVFNGTGETPWRETDATDPLSVYGKTKLEGERLLAQHCVRHLIFRTSWVVGAHGGNFLKTMLRLAAERDALSVVADQVGVPTSVGLLCDATIQAIKTMKDASGQDPRWGIYHVAAAGQTNWCAYAQYVLAGAIARGQVLRVQPQQVQAITTAQYPLPAPRPLNSRLNTHKFEQTFGMTLPAWQAGVDDILDELILRSQA
jgi:dTDP-4-dehydrorhamnose reductase